MTEMTTAIEVAKDGSRSVYHRRAEPNKEGWAWTHPDTKPERAKCTACTKGTLESIRAEVKGK